MARTVSLVAASAVAVLAIWCGSAAAARGTPPLPGPPPTAGAALPAAPSPGTVPSAGSTGPPASLPSRVSGPGLQSGFIPVRNRKLTLPLACSSSGRVTLTAPAIRSGTLARGRFTCRQRQASAQLTLRPVDARRLNGLKSTIAGVSFGAGAGGRFSIMLQSRPSPPPYWSDGGMECSLLGSDTPYLVAPNFTVGPPTIIDVRPWVAWYTAATGWRWLGTTGVNSSSWYRWSDTPAGVQQWFTPTGALNPWTWAPIRVRPGRGLYAVGVFEIVYWYHNSRYLWQYTRSRLGPTSTGTYCAYR